MTVVLVALFVSGGLGFAGWRWQSRSVAPPAAVEPAETGQPRFWEFGNQYIVWWGGIPAEVRQQAADTGRYSNIEPEDYVGASQCANCHADEYKRWAQHPHRWMNAAATADRVVGDFNNQRLRYQGGIGRFWRDGEQFRMTAERGPVKREWRITRTIGSRYFQYYVGVQLAGPEPSTDARYRTDHVLPFGYWLTKRQWVITVHIRDDRADDVDDPKLNPYEDWCFADYDRNCSQCHTTLPAGDWLLRNPDETGRYSPYRLGLDLTAYLKKHKPDVATTTPERLSGEDVRDRLIGLIENRPPATIAHLGIVCEACHNGCKQHISDPEKVLPHFYPTSPLLAAELPATDPHGRTKENVNWICARCHNGGRPRFPGGMATWNSVEYSDAVQGACYSRLRCIDCHDPHKPTGLTWPHSADHDDNLCLKCHEGYRDATARRAHTHHAPGTDGDRCMNCHMPKINEGLDQVVRTHTIFSPTKSAVIEMNGPNACNLCHLDKPIDWTLDRLRDWYGRSYRDTEIARNYPYRTQPVGEGWLKHRFQATRLVAASAYGRQRKRETLPLLFDILNDKYVLNRQFGQLAVEAVSGQRLEPLGYSFLLSPAERAEVLPRLRNQIR